MEMEFTFFWKQDGPSGFCCQWFQSKFTVDDRVFRCAEQYMMYQKAVLFGDPETGERIMAAKSPKNVKALGRQVRGFKESIWVANRERIIFEGNMEKFTQSPMLMQLLLDTGETILVEASPYDKIYGIGLSATHRNAKNPLRWIGKNLLGNALMEVRSAIRGKLIQEA